MTHMTMWAYVCRKVNDDINEYDIHEYGGQRAVMDALMDHSPSCTLKHSVSFEPSAC